MQHLLISVSDSTNLNALKTSLMKHKGVERVQTIENDEKSATPIEPDWKNRLHLPGPPLTDEQLEELALEMDTDTDTISLEQARQNFKEFCLEKWNIQL
jgi:hypothetical protein